MSSFFPCVPYLRFVLLIFQLDCCNILFFNMTQAVKTDTSRIKHMTKLSTSSTRAYQYQQSFCIQSFPISLRHIRNEDILIRGQSVDA